MADKNKRQTAENRHKRRFPEIQLQVLKSVVLIRDYKSAQAAAEKAGITISTIARQITDLENQLGVKLFERHPRGMRMTEAGKLYAATADRIIAELDRAGAQLEPAGSEIRGHVRVFISEVLVDDFLEENRWFTEKHPKVTVKVTIAFADQTRAALLKDEADIGYIFGLKSHRDLEFMARHEHPLVAVVGPDHELARSEVRLIKPETLLQQKYRLALPPRTYGTRRIFDSLLSKTTQATLSEGIQLELNSLQHLKWYVIHSGGVTILPALLARKDVDAGTLIAIDLDGDGDEMTSLSLCRPRHRPLNEAAQVLLERLTDAFKTLAAKL